MGVARDGVARVVRDFLALCRRLGIPEQKVRTAGLRIQPEYRYQNDGSPPVLVGYIVERQLDVDLGDLDRLGELIEGAIDAGVSQASPPEFASSRRADRQRDALAAAGEDARRNAERLAAALGARVGAVRQVSVGDGNPSPPMPMMRAAMAEGMAADAAGYTPGELRFDARVTVTFDLVAPCRGPRGRSAAGAPQPLAEVREVRDEGPGEPGGHHAPAGTRERGAQREQQAGAGEQVRRQLRGGEPGTGAPAPGPQHQSLDRQRGQRQVGRATAREERAQVHRGGRQPKGPLSRATDQVSAPAKVTQARYTYSSRAAGGDARRTCRISQMIDAHRNTTS
jgi:uncharacterized protein YggE